MKVQEPKNEGKQEHNKMTEIIPYTCVFIGKFIAADKVLFSTEK